MQDVIARLVEAASHPYVRRKFHVTKRSTPKDRMRNRLYYRRNKSKIRLRRKLARMRNKIHSRLRKQMRQTTSLRYRKNYIKPGRQRPSRSPGLYRKPGKSHTSVPKMHRLNLGRRRSW